FVSRKPEEQARVDVDDAIGALEQLRAIARGRLRDRVLDAARPRVWGGLVGVTPPVATRVSLRLLAQRKVAALAVCELAANVEAARQLASFAARTGDECARLVASCF